MNSCRQSPDHIPQWAAHRRRDFLKLGVLATGAAMVANLMTPPTSRLTPGTTAFAAGGTDVLLLSCMDYRLMSDVAGYMNQRGLEKNYDHVILAGASLGAMNEMFPAWGETFWQHLDAAIQLHSIHKVVVLDHRDCGAYRVILGEDLADDPARELEVHAERMMALRDAIRASHPSLEVELLLMALDGSVTPIAG